MHIVLSLSCFFHLQAKMEEAGRRDFKEKEMNGVIKKEGQKIKHRKEGRIRKQK